MSRFTAQLFDDVTLDEVAADAGVTVQTVIRRFGSKAGLLDALVTQQEKLVDAERGDISPGDVAIAVARLMTHYERFGDTVLNLLQQERRVPAYARIAASGRQVHLEWCRHAFGPQLSTRTASERARLLAQVVAVCDVYTWFLLRRQRGLTRRQTELALIELLHGVLP